MRLHRGLAAALLLSALGVGRGHTADDTMSAPHTTFFQANALYTEGHYTAAAREYERLVQAGLESGNLYFNLGNAYFKAGARGKAILNYERARRLIPGDSDVEANLAYARSLTGAETCEPSLWQHLAFPFADRVSTSELVGTTSAVYTLLLLTLAVSQFWQQRPRWLPSITLGLAGLFFVATASLAKQVCVQGWQRHAVIVRSGDTPARFAPAENGTVYFILTQGSVVNVLETREGWVQIARCDDRRGWVATAALEEL